MRLIDADALMELARNHIDRTVDCNDIARFPTIEAEPVRRGEWIYFHAAPEGWKVCSECLEQAHHPAGGDPYCHNCGAKMDKEG